MDWQLDFKPETPFDVTLEVGDQGARVKLSSPDYFTQKFHSISKDYYHDEYPARVLEAAGWGFYCLSRLQEINQLDIDTLTVIGPLERFRRAVEEGAIYFHDNRLEHKKNYHLLKLMRLIDYETLEVKASGETD